MGDLIYFAIASLNGYMEDENGDYEWSRPDEEVHAFINELERPVGTYPYGRRMYEVMRVWETPEAQAGGRPAGRIPWHRPSRTPSTGGMIRAVPSLPLAPQDTIATWKTGCSGSSWR